MTRICIVAAVVIIIALVFLGFRRDAREHTADDKPGTSGSSSSSSAHSQSPSSTTPRKTAKGRPLEDARPLRRIDPESRKLLHAEIAKARAVRVPAPSAGAPSPPPQALTPQYIQTQTQAILPLLNECYTEAQKEDPTLAGMLVVKITLGGEPDVGGLVESSEVDPQKSTILHAGMIECVRETMYGLELVAPEHGGVVTVVQTMVFSPVPSGSSAK